MLNVLSLFRRRAAERWVHAPARARRTNGYLNFFSLLGWKRAPARAPQSRGAKRYPEDYEVRSPPSPDFRLRSDPADVEPYGYEERTVAAQAWQPGRDWDEPGERYDDADLAGISRDQASARYHRRGEPADDARDDANVETPRTARRPQWDVPEQDDADATSHETVEPEREPHWAHTQQQDRYLAVRGVEKSFAGRKVVKGVSLYLRRGEAVGLLGPNGAGKTTTQRMLATLLVPTAGEATVAGCDLRRDPVGVRRQLGYVSQSGGTNPAAKVDEELVTQGQLYGMS
ncbi:MAG: ATP-binding cassette domain-containing protein, partial [Xanthobacteraceae bacterium]